MIIKIVNVVCTAQISPINDIIKEWDDIEYRPSGFPGIIYHYNGKRIDIFDSGKITSKGSKDSKTATSIIHEFFDIISSKGIKFNIIQKPIINMIVASCELDDIVDLDMLSKSSYFVKRMDYFPCVQLNVDGVNVNAYSKKLIVSGGSILEIKNVVKKVVSCS